MWLWDDLHSGEGSEAAIWLPLPQLLRRRKDARGSVPTRRSICEP
jgi:hypothetical protein